jgi:hypothetical protein
MFINPLDLIAQRINNINHGRVFVDFAILR